MSAVPFVGAGQNLDQAGLACAIVAEQAHDLAGIKIDRGVVDRLEAAEGERDVLHLDEGGSGLSVHGLSLGGSAAVEGVDADRADQHDADHHLLERRVEAEQHHA